MTGAPGGGNVSRRFESTGVVHAARESDGSGAMAVVLRAEEPLPARSRLDVVSRGVLFALWSARTFAGVAWQDWWWGFALIPPAVVLGLLAQRAWRRPHPVPTSWVTIGADGLARSEVPELVSFDELGRIDGHERWPNLTLHTRTHRVDLFPWSASRDDRAAAAVAQAVLEQAAAAGVDTTQQPVAMWRPSRHEVDWDRAIVPPSRWSRFRSSSSADRAN